VKTATKPPPIILKLARIPKEPKSLKNHRVASVTVAVSTTQQTLSLTQGWTKRCEFISKFSRKKSSTDDKMQQLHQGKLIHERNLKATTYCNNTLVFFNWHQIPRVSREASTGRYLGKRRILDA
jgi:hypothetical protein